MCRSTQASIKRASIAALPREEIEEIEIEAIEIEEIEEIEERRTWRRLLPCSRPRAW